jgi:putative aldouronate transport system permease protein
MLSQSKRLLGKEEKVIMKMSTTGNHINIGKGLTLLTTIKSDLIGNKLVYLMALPMLAYYLVICYYPMYGASIAFRDYSPMKGISQSPWIGLENFTSFFHSYYFLRVLKNTLMINIYSLIFGFPAPIILALLINEVRSRTFKKSVQTISYLPHFISTVVMCGMMIDFLSTNGVVNDLIVALGGTRSNLLMQPQLFQPLYVISGIWQDAGWAAIIYLAALSAINSELYEAAVIDGANRWKQTLSVTIPCLMPTIIIMLILRMGEMMSVGYEKIILLYNPLTYSTADVISSFVYRKGLLEFSYSYSTAVGLFNSFLNFILLISANWISRKTNETSLW